MEWTLWQIIWPLASMLSVFLSFSVYHEKKATLPVVRVFYVVVDHVRTATIMYLNRNVDVRLQSCCVSATKS